MSAARGGPEEQFYRQRQREHNRSLLVTAVVRILTALTPARREEKSRK